MDACKADENPAGRVLKYVQKRGQVRWTHTVHLGQGWVFR